MNGARIEVRLPPVPPSVAAAREAVDRLAQVVPPAVLEDARLLVSELVTNALRHAGLGQGDLVEVRLEAGANRLRGEVLDPGGGFAPPAGRPTWDQASGWGLYLVGELADRWGVEAVESTRVWFELDLRGPHRPSPRRGRGRGP